MKSLLLLAVTAGLASAQPKLADLAVLVYSDVIPSKTAENQASVATVRDTYKKAGTPFYLVLNRIFGGSHNLRIAPLSDLSSRDNGTALNKMMGEAAYQKFINQYRQTHSGNHQVLVRTIPSLTIQDAPVGSLPVVVVQRTLVPFDRRAEYETRLRDLVIPALKKAGVKRYVASKVIFGGPSNEYIITRAHNGLVEADKANEVIASLPASAGLVLSSERMVYRINPSLSYADGVQIR